MLRRCYADYRLRTMLYISIGSNLGDRESNLRTAVSRIAARIGPVVAESDIVETEPWGFETGNRFLNQVIAIDTALSPEDVLDITQQIERELGRSTKSSNGNYSDRPIDIDLLLYDDLIINTDRLTIPHPLMDRRRFVLEPLAQIAPSIAHPLLNEKILDLLNKL